MKDERLKEAFHNIRADEELKKHTLEYIFQKTHGCRRNAIYPYRRLAAAMACVLLVMAGWSGYSAYFTQTSAISIDINPSIELNINRFDKVISVETYNEDGYMTMSSMDVRFRDYRDALQQILASENMAQYLTQDYLISITVFGMDDEKSNEIITNLSSCAASYGSVHCAFGSPEEAAAAHAEGMSFGKYRAFLELQALDPDVTVEEARGLTMRQIRNLINELSGGGADTAQDGDADNGNSGHNPGHGNGNGSRNGNRYRNGSGHSGTSF